MKPTSRKTGHSTKSGAGRPRGEPVAARRVWLFRLLLAVAGPLMLLGLLEAGLRVCGYGYDTAFFKPMRVGQEECLVENDKFGWRFFPPELARSPAPVVMKAHKAPDTCRIFILGESAALGDPRPAYGAGRYLQALLEARFPRQKFEVICVAMTAINSHAIVPLAGECARHDGDIWVIYMGNNEMVGPFGAISVFGSQAPDRAFVRFVLGLERTKLGQLLVACGRKLKGATSGQSWGGMEMFAQSRVAPGDARREVVYRNFRENLEDIVQAGLRSGAKVVLSTVAVNLKDCGPFASMSETNGPSTQPAGAEKLFQDGLAAETRTNVAQAVASFDSAAKLDPNRSDIEFHLGRCLLVQTNYGEARRHLQQACDLDALPFRADSTIEQAIQAAGHKHAGKALHLFDAAAWLGDHSQADIPGWETFYEHVHLNFDGNYLLGLGWAEQVASFLPENVRNTGGTNWADQAACERRLGLSDWNREPVLDEMIRRLAQPPFTSQIGHEQQVEWLRAERQRVRSRITQAAADQAAKDYVAALERAPEDYRLRENFAEFLEQTANVPLASAEWIQVSELVPEHHLAYFEAGRLKLKQGRLAEAQKWLQQAVGLRPDLSEGWLELGNIDMLAGKPVDALPKYARARALLPQDPRVHYQMGKAFSRTGRRVKAIECFREAVRLQPAFAEAHYALGEELAFSGAVEAARKQFEEVLRLKPDDAMSHLNLGVALYQQGELTNALREFQQTQRLDPTNQLAGTYLEKVQALLVTGDRSKK